MKGRLWLLNLTLLVLVIWTGTLVRDRWRDARAREALLLQQQMTPAPPPALAPLPPVTPAPVASYLDVAQKMLFVRDRNPTLILDPPPPPPAPKPMPPLPVAQGVIDVGAGPSAILSEKPGGPVKRYRAGEKIGEFTLVAMSNKEIVFEWEGQQIRRKLEELRDKRPPVQNTPQEQNAPAAAPPPQATSITPQKAGPGQNVGGEFKACVAGDNSPPGTVVDGMRKVVGKSPFGDSCRWEPVR